MSENTRKRSKPGFGFLYIAFIFRRSMGWRKGWLPEYLIETTAPHMNKFLPLLLIAGLAGSKTELSNAISFEQAFGRASVSRPLSGISIAETKKAKVIRRDNYTGTINNKYKVSMTIGFDEPEVWGDYKYVTQNDLITLVGTYDVAKRSFSLEERAPDGEKTKLTGYFEGTLSGNQLSGTWSNAARTKSFPFSLTRESKPLPPLTFAFHFENIEDGINGISVFDVNGKEIQVLQDFNAQPSEDNRYLQMQDINFDGYPDLGLFEASYAGANVSYVYWLYNASANKFERVPEGEMPSFDSIDYVKKQVMRTQTDGPKSSTNTYTYRFYDGHFHDMAYDGN